MAVAVVTGAGRGIGRATSLALAQAGFAVGAVSRSPEGLDETHHLLARAEATHVGIVTDVTDREAVREAVSEIVERLGPVSVLVNNAGSLRAIGPLWEVDPVDWWTDVNVSLGGVFACCREVVPAMIDRRAGRIINLVSYAAFRPAPYQTGYAAAKAAVTSLTEGLAASLGSYGVTVFGVAPGFTETEMTRNLIESAAGRRWLPQVGKTGVVAPERTAHLITQLALGEGDGLSGRIFHTLDELDDLRVRVETIDRDDLYVPRLRRLPNITIGN
jgi:NAD(P)-dependent dehydrogenase (short-subunit alcohol dehydrogenase family)